MLQDVLETRRGEYLHRVVDDHIFCHAYNELVMQYTSVRDLAHCTMQCIDLEMFQIKFLLGCRRERRTALRDFSGYSRVMQWSDKMWVQNLDDFREGVESEPDKDYGYFGTFIEEWVPEIEFPWILQICLKQTKQRQRVWCQHQQKVKIRLMSQHQQMVKIRLLIRQKMTDGKNNAITAAGQGRWSFTETLPILRLRHVAVVLLVAMQFKMVSCTNCIKIGLRLG